MEIVEGGGEVSQLVRPPRRPDVDVVRIVLTWGILLFHTTVAFSPGMTWYVKSYGWSPGADWVAVFWVSFMDIWQMPMFFFLSGVSAYFALFRRTERQFREERAHRLFVPWLLLCLLNGVYSVAWLAFTKYFLDHYAGGPNSGQGWFLLYLFAYSQALAGLLCLWHPNHGPKNNFCCPVPYSRVSKVLGCMCFFFKPAATPQDLVTAVLWWLGHPVKLALLPILAFGVPEAMRAYIPGALGTLFMDWPNNFNYTFIFLFGYTITAADQSGMKEVLKRGRWLYLGLGLILCIPYSFSWNLDPLIPNSYLGPYWMAKGLWRAAGEWTLVLGIYSVIREMVTTQYRHLPLMSQMAMPFYLTHQQILVTLLSAFLWVPVLGSFPVMLLLATLATIILSFAITKLSPLRYWFGLPPPKDSLLPGTILGGFLPLIVLLVVVVMVICIQFFV